MSNKKNEICELMDKLTIEMLDLIEQKVRCEIDIEKRTHEGKLLLAKTRYIHGTNTITKNQLPTENAEDFNSLTKVIKVPNEPDDNFITKNKFKLEKYSVDKPNNYIDPIKWFGVLVPRSLQFAKERFQMSIELVIECANIQNKLKDVITYLYKLNNIKERIN